MNYTGFVILGGGLIWATWALYTHLEQKEREKKARALTISEQEKAAVKHEKQEKRQDEWDDAQHKIRLAEAVNYAMELRIKNIRIEMQNIIAERELEALRNPKPSIAPPRIDKDEQRRRTREGQLKRLMEDVEFEILKTAKTRATIKQMVGAMMQDELKRARDEDEKESIIDQYDALEDRLLDKSK